MILYPNPVTDHLMIESDVAEFSIQLFNSTGQAVLSDASSVGRLKLDMSEMTSGVYYVAISSKEGNIRIEKVIKQ